MAARASQFARSRRLTGAEGGVEATDSRLKRRFRIGELRIRGAEAVRLSVTLKLQGLNIYGATVKIRKRQNLETPKSGKESREKGKNT